MLIATLRGLEAKGCVMCTMTNEEYAVLSGIVLKRYARWSVNEWPLTVWYGAGNTCTIIIISLHTCYDTNQRL